LRQLQVIDPVLWALAIDLYGGKCKGKGKGAKGKEGKIKVQGKFEGKHDEGKGKGKGISGPAMARGMGAIGQAGPDLALAPQVPPGKQGEGKGKGKGSPGPHPATDEMRAFERVPGVPWLDFCNRMRAKGRDPHQAGALLAWVDFCNRVRAEGRDPYHPSALDAYVAMSHGKAGQDILEGKGKGKGSPGPHPATDAMRAFERLVGHNDYSLPWRGIGPDLAMAREKDEMRAALAAARRQVRLGEPDPAIDPALLGRGPAQPRQEGCGSRGQAGVDPNALESVSIRAHMCWRPADDPDSPDPTETTRHAEYSKAEHKSLKANTNTDASDFLAKPGQETLRLQGASGVQLAICKRWWQMPPEQQAYWNQKAERSNESSDEASKRSSEHPVALGLGGGSLRGCRAVIPFLGLWFPSGL
jgi:hypothetical protein